MKVIDNFLQIEDFKKIKETVCGINFPWYYNNFSSHKEDNIPMLNHIFYRYFEPNKVLSSYISLLDPLFNKLQITGLIRVKANLVFPSKQKEKEHIDYPFKNSSTAVYYLNTNNGGTKIKNKIINSKENRVLILDSNTPHTVIRQTDSEQGRFVININYYTV